MARNYRRDSRGRFSSTGTTGRSKPKALPGGTLAARTSLRKSRQKLAGKDAADLSLSGTLSRRSQAAAVTRGKNRLREAVKSSRVKIAAGPGGVIRRGGTQRQSTPPKVVPPARKTRPRQQGDLMRGERLKGVIWKRLSGEKMTQGAGKRGKRREYAKQNYKFLREWWARAKNTPSRGEVQARASRYRNEPLTTDRGGTVFARTSLRRSRERLKQNDTPSQRGAVTRGIRYLREAKKRDRVTLGTSVKDRFIRGKNKAQPGALVKPTPALTPASTMPRGSSGPSKPRIADAMRDSLRQLAQSDARFYRSLEKDLGIKLPTPKATSSTKLPPAPGGSRSSGSNVKVSTVLRENLRRLALSDAQRLREIDELTRTTSKGSLKGSSSSGKPRISGSKPRLPGGRSKRKK